MTDKEIKEYKKELLDSLIEKYIGGSISKLNNKNKKLYKDILRKDVNKSIFTISYVKDQFYGWVVELKDYELNSNFDRFIYLFNHNYDVCCDMLEVDDKDIDNSDYEFTFKTSKELKSYKDLAEEVGL